MIYGYVLIPNKFYRQYIKLYISHQSKFLLYPITLYICGDCLSNIHFFFGKPYSHFLLRNHSYPILRQYGFETMGAAWHVTYPGQTVTMTNSGMNRTMRISPKNFTRTSGKVEPSLLWDYQQLMVVFATILVSLPWHMQPTPTESEKRDDRQEILDDVV